MPSQHQEFRYTHCNNLRQNNQILYRANGEAKINDNALVALALMTAKSLPQQKETVVALIVNMLVESE